jgi:hypothetical protein
LDPYRDSAAPREEGEPMTDRTDRRDREELVIVALIALTGAIGVATGLASRDHVLEVTLGGAMLFFGARGVLRVLRRRS